MKHFLFAVLMSFPALAQAQSNYDFVQVSGEGEVKVKPDYVTLNATVYSRAASAQQAQKDNAREMARVDRILRQDFRVEAKDLQTYSFQVAPQYEYSKDRPIYKGIAVTHTLNIKFRKVDDVGALLDRLVTGGAQEGFGVRIEDIAFATDQLKSYQTQALEQAMADAKARGQVLAKAGSRTLGSVRKISDSRIQVGGVEPIRSFNKMAFSSMAEDSGRTQMAPGEISVRAVVQVEYEMK